MTGRAGFSSDLPSFWSSGTPRRYVWKKYMFHLFSRLQKFVLLKSERWVAYYSSIITRTHYGTVGTGLEGCVWTLGVTSSGVSPFVKKAVTNQWIRVIWNSSALFKEWLKSFCKLLWDAGVMERLRSPSKSLPPSLPPPPPPPLPEYENQYPFSCRFC